MKTTFHQGAALACMLEGVFVANPWSAGGVSAARQGSGPAMGQLCLQPVLITVLFIILVRLYALQVCGDEENVIQNFFFASFVGNCEIDLEIKRYFCRAGVQSIQVRFFLFQSSKIFHALFEKKVAKLYINQEFL